MAQGPYKNQGQRSRTVVAATCGFDNPSVVATEGTQGVIYCQLGTTNVWQKQDDGITTNWVLLIASALGAIPGYYPVFVGGPYPTIQSAIDQAVLDGYGGFNTALVDIYPGVYVENISLATGIHLEGRTGAVIEGQIEYNIPPGGIIPGQSTILKQIFVRQQSGLYGIVVNGAPGDFAVLILDDCAVVNFNPAEPFSNILIDANLCITQIRNLRGFAGSSDPNQYVIECYGILVLRDMIFNTNNGHFLLAAGSSIQGKNLTISTDGGNQPAIVISPGVTVSIVDSTFQSLAAGPQNPVSMGIGSNYFSVGNIYLVNIDAGSRVISGPAGSNYNYSFDTYPFSSQIDLAITATALNTTPTPV